MIQPPPAGGCCAVSSRLEFDEQVRRFENAAVPRAGAGHCGERDARCVGDAEVDGGGVAADRPAPTLGSLAIVKPRA